MALKGVTVIKCMVCHSMSAEVSCRMESWRQREDFI